MENYQLTGAEEIPSPVQEKKEVVKKPKTPKPWYVQILVLIFLVLGVVFFVPLILLFIVCLAVAGIIPFCSWQMFSFLKEIPKQRRARLTNGNYCRLQVKKLELKNEKK